eukprot:gnl/TRDRNA2_/TRDRNA2_174353_c4_seq5.p1 gnl/TRDRNA2_/TRDRNA2_174353_c4~~gnl/TRDRNA2_/TRDRNA2_174353_c4_seq5.p1  ORF type:complete len:100 (-),score=3.38 gnl/TRDRNA2_/TRDRNA2_174353_c4_seq5:125-424(-)
MLNNGLFVVFLDMLNYGLFVLVLAMLKNCLFVLFLVHRLNYSVGIDLHLPNYGLVVLLLDHLINLLTLPLPSKHLSSSPLVYIANLRLTRIVSPVLLDL